MILAWAAAQAVFGTARDFKGLWNRLGEYYKAEGKRIRRPFHAASLFQQAPWSTKARQLESCGQARSMAEVAPPSAWHQAWNVECIVWLLILMPHLVWCGHGWGWGWGEG